MCICALGEESLQVELGMFQRVLGAVLVAGEPLTTRQLCMLLNLEKQDFAVVKVLCRVRKIISKWRSLDIKIFIKISSIVPQGSDERYNLIHKSVFDYFSSFSRAGEYAVNVAECHQSVFFVILGVLVNGSFSKQEWLSAESSKTPIKEVEDATLFLGVYGLRYWWKHLEAFARSQPRFREKLLTHTHWRAFVSGTQGTFALITGVLWPGCCCRITAVNRREKIIRCGGGRATHGIRFII